MKTTIRVLFLIILMNMAIFIGNGIAKDMYFLGGDGNWTKAKALCFKAGWKVMGLNEFDELIKIGPNKNVLAFGDLNPERIIILDRVLQNGVKIIWVACNVINIQKVNEISSDKFEFVIEIDEIFKPNFKGNNISNLWNGLEVGIDKDCDTYPCKAHIKMFFATRNPSIELAKYLNEKTNREKVTSIKLMKGDGNAIIISGPCSYQYEGFGQPSSYRGSVFLDKYIEQLDNEDAFKRLLEWHK